MWCSGISTPPLETTANNYPKGSVIGLQVINPATTFRP